jgi:hypothetical protein
MEFGFGPQLSVEVLKHSPTITWLDQQMTNYFKGKIYSSEIQGLYIGIIVVSPEFEPFFKPRKPRKKNENFEYEIKFEYEQFKHSSESEVLKIISERILSSLDVLDKLKNFDRKNFENDIRSLFNSLKINI